MVDIVQTPLKYSRELEQWFSHKKCLPHQQPMDLSSIPSTFELLHNSDPNTEKTETGGSGGLAA